MNGGVYYEHEEGKCHTGKAKKWQLKRFVIIHDAIKRGNYPSFKKLQRLCEEVELEASKSTIERILNDLRNCFGVPIEYDRARNGYYLLDDNYDFSVNSVSTHDVFYLSTAKTMLSTFKGTSVYDSISDVIDFVTDTQCMGRSNLLKRIAVPPVPRIAGQSEKAWNLILTAMQENASLSLTTAGDGTRR